MSRIKLEDFREMERGKKVYVALTNKVVVYIFGGLLMDSGNNASIILHDMSHSMEFNGMHWFSTEESAREYSKERYVDYLEDQHDDITVAIANLSESLQKIEEKLHLSYKEAPELVDKT